MPITPPLPTLICLASFGERVIAYGHENTLEDAHAWCRHARSTLLAHTDQVAIATPQEASWMGVGRALTLAFVAGWIRAGLWWHVAGRELIRLSFDEIAAGPTAKEELRAPATPPNSREELRSAARHLTLVARSTNALAVTAQTLARTKPLVLIASAEAQTTLALRHALSTNFATIECSSFTDAVLELAHSAFDAVIADQDIGPIGSGLLLLAEVRTRWPQTRCVLCTPSAEARAQATASGVADAIGYPLDPRALHQLLPAKREIL